MYGKATETAIAAMSRLAEVYDGGRVKLSAADIADERGLQRPFVCKVLTTLASAGLVTGTRGPGGGFTLARDPSDIRIYDVYCLFEREENGNACPFGGGVCGVGDPCPMHDKLVAVQQAIDAVLHETSFEIFRTEKAADDEGVTHEALTSSRDRETFRAAPSRRKRGE